MTYRIKTNLGFLFLLGIIISLGSCKKANPGISFSYYTWSWKGNTYDASFKSVHSGGGPSIIARTGNATSANNITIGIYINSLAVGTYSCEYVTNNSFLLTDENGTTFTGDIVTVSISANANGHLSGNFSGIIKSSPGSSQFFPISGYFSNVPIEN